MASILTHQDPASVIDFLMQDDIIEPENENYSTWLAEGSLYAPATDLNPIDKLPNGVYKIISTNNGLRIQSIPINSDELYTFSNDYTETILKEVENFWNNLDTYKKHKLIPRRGILLEGPPGSGKSSIITLLTKQLIEKDGLVFLINSDFDLRTAIDGLSTIVRKIEPDRPIITIIEDVDCIIEEAGTPASILDFMDGKHSINNHLVILTSNNTSNLSPALLRPSRIDTRYELPNPSAKIRKEFFIKKGIEHPEEYAEATKGMSFAELKEVFIGTQILGKSLEQVIKQIKTPLAYKDHLTKSHNMKGLI